MEIRQLVHFKTVADVKNLTEASKVLYITQAALSKSISALERELGTQLFDRSSHKMLLNDIGRMFYNRIRNILNELDFATQEVRQLSNQEMIVLTIATEMPELFCPIVTAYHKFNPTIVIQAFSNFRVTNKEALVFGNVSFCITSTQYDHPSLVWFELCMDEMLLITPHSHPKATEEFAALASFQHDPFVTTATGTNMHQLTTAFCKTAHFEPAVTVISPEIDMVPMLVSTGCGCALMSKWVHDSSSAPRMDPQRPPYHVVHITEPPCYRRIGVCLRRDHMLTELEYNFLLFLLTYFHPEYKENPNLLRQNILYQFLQTHHMV